MCEKKNCNNYNAKYDNSCRALNETIANCPFFKTKEQYVAEVKELKKRG